MEYKSVQTLLTTWTVCKTCWAVVAHVDWRRHDAWHAAQAQAEQQPMLEAAS